MYPIIMLLIGLAVSLAPFIPNSWVVNIKCWYYRVFTKTIKLDYHNNLLTKMDVISFDSQTRYLYVGKDRLKKLN